MLRETQHDVTEAHCRHNGSAFLSGAMMSITIKRPGRCRKHGIGDFVCVSAAPGKKRVFRCEACYRLRSKPRPPLDLEKKARRLKNAYRRAHENRLAKRHKIVDLFGGACVKCGYDKCKAALHFHHKDTSEKSFQISTREMWREESALLEEAKKCELVCANCHYESHFDDGTMGPRTRLIATP